jgi:transketolase
MNCQIHDIQEKGQEIRRLCAKMFAKSGHGHFGGSFSCADMVAALYFGVLRNDAKNPRDPARDRFVLSKGHAAPAVYAALALRGFFDMRLIDEYENLGANLSTHPNMLKVPGIDFSAGSLGHGLSLALGMAICGKTDKLDYRVYAMLGDGECNEGSVWEAAMAAPKYGVDNLIAIVDRNRLAAFGATEDIMPLEPFPQKWEAFNWETFEVDGHDIKAFLELIKKSRERVNGKPKCIIAHTVKGKGVDFMENNTGWHGHAIDQGQYAEVLRQLKTPAKEGQS